MEGQEIQTISLENSARNKVPASKRSNIVYPTNNTEYNNCRETHPLYSELKKFLFVMKLSGSFHDPPFQDVGRLESIVWKAWHFIVCLIACFNFLRFVPELWKTDLFPGLTYSEIIIGTYFFYCFGSVAVSFMMCAKKDRLLAFFEHNQKFCNSDESRDYLNCVPEKHDLRLGVRVSYVLNALWQIFGMTNLMYTLFKLESPSYHIMTAPWTSNLSIGIFMAIALIINLAAAQHILLFCLICRYLTKQFKLLSKTFSKLLLDSEDGRKGEVNEHAYELIRQQHNHLCDSVMKADDSYSVFVLMICFCNIPLMIFIAYQCIYIDANIETKISYGYWLIVVSITVIAVTCQASILNNEIHSFNDKILRLNAISGSSNDKLTTIHMLFLARVNGPPVGFTMIGLLVINKEVLLTGVGLVFTYFMLLVQFK